MIGNLGETYNGIRTKISSRLCNRYRITPILILEGDTLILCREKVVVAATRPYITFEGAGRKVTVIEWHDRACDPGPNGEQLRTYRTASVTVFADLFSARNISFKVLYVGMCIVRVYNIFWSLNH